MKIARGVGYALGGVVALVGVVYFGLQTPLGDHLLRPWVTAQINKSIQGHVALDAVEFRGRALTVRGLVLTDPEGAVVATLKRLRVTYRFTPLFRKTIDIHSVDVEAPSLWLRREQGGLNIARAVAPRTTTTTTKPNGQSPDLTVNLERMSVTGGRIEYQAQPKQPEPLQTISDLSLDAAALIALRPSEALGHLNLGATAIGAIAGPIGVALKFDTRERGLRAEAQARVADLLFASVKADNRQSIALEQFIVRVPPNVARAFVPSWPVRPTLVVNAQAGFKAPVAGFNVSVRGENTGGHLAAHGDLLADGTATPSGLELIVDGVHLSDWLLNTPVLAPFRMHFVVAPGSLRPSAATADLSLQLRATTLRRASRDVTVGPLLARIATDRGRLKTLDVRGQFPGVILATNGRSEGGQTRADATMNIDLAPVLTALSALGVAAPIAEGRVAVAIRAQGPEPLGPNGWHAAMSVSSPRMIVSKQRFVGAGFTLAVADQGRDAALRSQWQVNSSVKLVAPQDVSLVLKGVLSASVVQPFQTPVRRFEFATEQVEVRLSHTKWNSPSPAQLGSEGERAWIRSFILASGAQRISVDGSKDVQNVNARLDVRALDLHELPLPTQMWGSVDLTAAAKGATSSPDLDVDLRLAHGGVDRVRDVEARLTGSLTHDHAVTAVFHVDSAQIGNIKGHLSTSWPAAPDTPVNAHVEAGVKLAKLPVRLPSGVHARGTLALTADLGGSVSSPQVRARLMGQRLVLVHDHLEAPPLDIPRLALDATYRDPQARAEISLSQATGGRLQMSVTTSLPLATLRGAKTFALAGLPVNGRARLVAIDPRPVVAFVPALGKLEGRLSGRARVAGTVGAPQIKGDLGWKNGEVIVANPTDEAKAGHK